MRLYTFRGEARSLPAWSRVLGVPESTLRSRLGKLGLSVEEAFTRPVDDRFHPTRKSAGPPPIAPVPTLERRADGRTAAAAVLRGVRHRGGDGRLRPVRGEGDAGSRIQ